ncbi:MAG: PAS domain S-box protein [Hyphomonadaceae bacterium]
MGRPFPHNAAGAAAYSSPEPAGVNARSPLDFGPVTTRSGAKVKEFFSDERFRTVTETMVDGLIVIDAAGVIRYVNPGCNRLFLYADGELLGKNISSLMPSPFAEMHDGYLARHRDTKVKRIIGIGRELTGLKASGETFPMYLSVGEASIGGETAFVGVIYDLTEKKRAEEMLLHHQKLDAIGQLTGGIAHDFNNILSIVSGNLEIIEGLDLPPAAKRAIARAQDASMRAARITQRLLAFARRQPLTRRTLDPNGTLKELYDMLRRSMPETIDIQLEFSENLPPIETDIDQFETAILNLATNARDAMPDGGELCIETDMVRYDEAPWSPEQIPAGTYVRVCVCDNGTGMTPDIRDRAMEPFFTTKGAGVGTGLGLSMVYGFLKQLGGHARIYSEPGRGTRVSLFFPAAEVDGAIPLARNDEATPMGHGELVLVVEDDPDVREVSVARIEALGYRVCVAVDGPSALETLSRNPDIRAAVLDVVMPGPLDGHALAERIVDLAPEIGVILTSGYSERMATAGDMRWPFLSKPVPRVALARTLRNVLNRPEAANQA